MVAGVVVRLGDAQLVDGEAETFSGHDEDGDEGQGPSGANS